VGRGGGVGGGEVRSTWALFLGLLSPRAGQQAQVVEEGMPWRRARTVVET
jgi:hypothetical protein